MAEKKIDPASAPPTPAEVSVMVQGDHIVFQTDMANAFYTYDKDPAGQSACDDKCAEAWPPVLAHGEAKTLGAWTLVNRKGGAKQWAYKGKPIYTYTKDVPGENKGDGVGGVWHVLKP